MKKVGPPSVQTTCEQLKQKVADVKIAIAFFGDAGSSAFSEDYLSVANNPSVSEKFSFFHMNDEACAKSYGTSGNGGIVLFRKFDESPVVYSGALSASAIIDWIQAQSVPTLIDFSDEYIEPIFGQRKAALFLFRNTEDDETDFSKVFAEAANKMKGEILFVKSGVKDGI